MSKQIVRKAIGILLAVFFVGTLSAAAVSAGYGECGWGHNDGCGCGHNDGCGCGYNDGCGCGYNDGCGCGHNDGCGCGHNDKCGCGNNDEFGWIGSLLDDGFWN